MGPIAAAAVRMTQDETGDGEARAQGFTKPRTAIPMPMRTKAFMPSNPRHSLFSCRHVTYVPSTKDRKASLIIV